MASHPSAAQFPSTPMIILVVDLTGYARGFLSRSDSEMAGFLDRFYRMAEDVIQEQGGKILLLTLSWKERASAEPSHSCPQ